MTAPAPSSKAPTAITAFFIGELSVAQRFQTPRSRPGRVAAHFSVTRPRRFIPSLKAMPALVLADGDPDPFGGGGHVDVIDLVLAPEALDDGVDHCRAGT